MTSIDPDFPPTSGSSSLTFAPATLRFGPLPVGEADVRAVVVQNGTSEAAKLAIAPGAPEFSILGSPTTVDAGEEATLFLQYRSAAEGTHDASLTATGASGELGRCSLSGTTIPPLRIDPSAIAFGDVPVGQSRVDSLFVTNATGSDVDLQLDATSGGTFTISPSKVPSTSVPTLILITYVPDNIGPDQATLRVSDSLSASLTGAGVVPEDPEFVDANAQRFKVEVPTDNARLFLGAGVTSSPGVTFSNVDGCGLDADSNIYLSARNGRVFARAGAGVFLHADSGTAVLSSNGGAAYVAGKGGVTICAGAKVGVGDTFDSTPDTSTIDGLAKTSASLDVIVAAGIMAAAWYSLCEDWHETSWFMKRFETVGALAATVAPVFGGLGAGGVLPGVSIFGAGGVSIFSPAYTGVYGAMGLALVSTYPTVFGIVDAAMWALDDIGLVAWRGSVKAFGKTSVTVRSAETVSIEASTNNRKDGGVIELKGKSITIGSDKFIEKAAPLTERISVGAGQSLEIKIGAGWIKMDAAGNIELGTDGNTIKIGPAGIELTGVTVTATGGGESSLELNDKNVALSFGANDSLIMDQNRIHLSRQNAGSVSIAPNLTSLYYKPDANIIAGPSGLQFHGEQHDFD